MSAGWKTTVEIGNSTICVLTSRGMAAISSVALAGDGARGILEKVFRSDNPLPLNPSGLRPPSLGRGGAIDPSKKGEFRIYHGVIVDGERVVDEVVVGCEGRDAFVIHCHGNPLLVEQIVSLLQSHGVVLVDAEQFAGCQGKNAIAAEAKLAMQKSATLLGVKILWAQIDGGLSAWAGRVLERIDSLDAENIKCQCSEILEHSRIAKQIIEGVRIVIAGPPNSGKSTLLNCLAGQQQVIVSDTAGTTRDWVNVTARLGDGVLCAEFIDTAGLDEALAGKDDVEQTAQAMTRELLTSCDLVLFVQDITEQAVGRRQWADMPVICVSNKCDLIQEPKDPGTQEHETISISAKNNEGIGRLVRNILERLGITAFDIAKPVAFTDRQRDLLLAILSEKKTRKQILSELLNPTQPPSK